MVVIYVVIHDEVNNNKHTLFTHAASSGNKNSLKHVREGKKDLQKEIICLYKTFLASNDFDVYNLKFIYVQTVLKLKANHCYN